MNPNFIPYGPINSEFIAKIYKNVADNLLIVVLNAATL